MLQSMSWDQFEGWVSKKMSGCNPEADLIKSFKVFDTRGDGTLSTDELAQVRPLQTLALCGVCHQRLVPNCQSSSSEATVLSCIVFRS